MNIPHWTDYIKQDVQDVRICFKCALLQILNKICTGSLLFMYLESVDKCQPDQSTNKWSTNVIHQCWTPWGSLAYSENISKLREQISVLCFIFCQSHAALLSGSPKKTSWWEGTVSWEMERQTYWFSIPSVSLWVSAWLSSQKAATLPVWSERMKMTGKVRGSSACHLERKTQSADSANTLFGILQLTAMWLTAHCNLSELILLICDSAEPMNK